MVDNLEIILPHLIFESSDDFYFLQLLQRRKDNDGLKRHTKVVENYFINNREYLVERYEKIKEKCRFFNARAMIRLNKRSYKKVAAKTISLIADGFTNDDFKVAQRAFSKACGQTQNAKKDKRWLIDIDRLPDESDEQIQKRMTVIKDMVNQCMPLDREKVLFDNPSKTGFHIITRTFNLHEFGKLLNGQIKISEIQKDSPTTLFIP